MTDTLSPDRIEALFTRADGQYLCARWGRPIAPIVFGVDDRTLEIVKGAIEAVAVLAGHKLAETDPELGANLMFFFFRDWDELTDVPDLDRLIPDLARLVARLKADGANQYRTFRFDESGAIKAAFVFVCIDEGLEKLPAETLALGQVVQIILLWSDRAFAEQSPLAVVPETGAVILRPEVAGVIRAAYDTVLPDATREPSHALRLFARLGAEENG